MNPKRLNREPISHDQGKYREEMMWLKNAANLGDQRAIDILEGYSNAR